MAGFESIGKTTEKVSVKRISQRDIIPLVAKSRNIFQKGKNGYIEIDTANNRIIINDGENDRILIGFGKGLF